MLPRGAADILHDLLGRCFGNWRLRSHRLSFVDAMRPEMLSYENRLICSIDADGGHA